MRPPPKDSQPNADNLAALDAWLTSILAYRPASAERPWLFYEELDRYLGPWGDGGYPIAYGKRYCVLFYTNHTLQEHPASRQWVRRTLLLLQTELKAFVLARYRQGTLAALTESELRQAAFDSHPKAYTEGGLTMLAMIEPLLLMEIASIPNAEFRPTSVTFGASVKQVLQTAKIAVPQGVGLVLAGMAGPAHTGVLRRAMAMDRDRLLQEMRVSAALADVRRSVVGGGCDNLVILAQLSEALSQTGFGDEGAAIFAREIVKDIERRQQHVARRYVQEVARDPTLLPIFQSFDTQACRWRP